MSVSLFEPAAIICCAMCPTGKADHIIAVLVEEYQIDQGVTEEELKEAKMSYQLYLKTFSR